MTLMTIMNNINDTINDTDDNSNNFNDNKGHFHCIRKAIKNSALPKKTEKEGIFAGKYGSFYLWPGTSVRS